MRSWICFTCMLGFVYLFYSFRIVLYHIGSHRIVLSCIVLCNVGLEYNTECQQVVALFSTNILAKIKLPDILIHTF